MPTEAVQELAVDAAKLKSGVELNAGHKVVLVVSDGTGTPRPAPAKNAPPATNGKAPPEKHGKQPGHEPAPHHESKPAPHHEAKPPPHHEAKPAPHHEAKPPPHHEAKPAPHHEAKPPPHHEAKPAPHHEAKPPPHHEPKPAPHPKEAPPPDKKLEAAHAYAIGEKVLGEWTQKLKSKEPWKEYLDSWVNPAECCANFVSACLQQAGLITRSMHSDNVNQLCANLERSPRWQVVPLERAVKGDYVRLVTGPSLNDRHAVMYSHRQGGTHYYLGSNNVSSAPGDQQRISVQPMDYRVESVQHYKG